MIATQQITFRAKEKPFLIESDQDAPDAEVMQVVIQFVRSGRTDNIQCPSF
jgi:hypothetical protein